MESLAGKGALLGTQGPWDWKQHTWGRISMGCGSLLYGPLDILRGRRHCLSLPKQRKTTEAARVIIFFLIQIILQHISQLSESEVLTTGSRGKQRASTGQGGFLNPVLVHA